MENNQVRIKIDANGNVHREIVEEQRQQENKPRLMKRLTAAFNSSAV